MNIHDLAFSNQEKKDRKRIMSNLSQVLLVLFLSWHYPLKIIMNSMIIFY